MKDKRLIGIDFGTTNSCLCHTRYNPQRDNYDEPRTIDFDTRPVLRSVLLLDEQRDQAIGWGETIYKSPEYHKDPARAREEFKLLIGRDPQAARYVTMLFQHALRVLLQRLNVTALSPERDHVVVGVPAQWAEPQRAATCAAVEMAGFPAVETTAEPVGAMVYHHFLGDITYQSQEDCTLVIDIGGGTTDFVLVQTHAGGQSPKILHTYGERYGGKDFDQAILGHLMRRHWRGGEPTPIEQVELLRAARGFKEAFSAWITRDRVNDQFRWHTRALGGFVSLTQPEFESEELCGPLIERFSGIVLKGLRGSPRTPQQVNRVILTGGSARWYFVKEAIQSMFVASPVLLSANPEQAIAKGLALARAEFKPQAQVSDELAVVEQAASSSMVLPPALPEAALALPDPDLRPLSMAELRACRNEAHKRILIYTGSGVLTAVVLSPIIGSSAVLTGMEAKMVWDISKIYGYKLTLEQAAAVVGGLLAGGTVLKVAVTEALTFLPGVGWVLKGGVAGGAMGALGKAAIHFFEQRRKEPEIEMVDEAAIEILDG